MRMIVELCGVPGGGKSTFARRYLQRATDTDLVTLDMHKRLPELWYAGVFAIRHPVSFFYIIFYVFKYHMEGVLLFSLHLAVRACAKYQKAQFIQARIALVDEGLVHVLMTLPATPISRGEAARWLHKIILPDAVRVVTEGDFHRLNKGRDVEHPRAVRGDEAVYAWQKAVRANVATFAEELRNKGVKSWDGEDKL